MNNKQGLTIAALIIAIIGLSIGFAAFSNTLQISSSASVNPDASALKVVFAKDYFTEQKTTLNQLDTTAVVPTTVGTGITATNGVINNDGQNGPTLTGLSAAFTEPGQSATYNLYVVNAGQLKAYLTDVVFGTTGSPAKKVSCTVAQTKRVNNADVALTDEEKATQSLVDAACEGISVSVKVGSLSAMTASGSLNNLPLEVKGYEPVQVVITYATGSAYVDGPMNVAFGTISFTASSNQGSSQGGSVPTPATPTYSVGDIYTGDFISTTAGVITDYVGNGGVITIPETLPVVEASTSTFNSTKCNSLMGDSVWCTEAQKKYNGLDYDENFDDSYGAYDQALQYILDSTYVVSNATPQTITEIGTGAIALKGITGVTFTNNITTIGVGAFSSNSITSLDIPSSVTKIEASAFAENGNLATVTIHNVEGLVAIDDDAFAGQSGGTVITYVGTGQ